MSDECRVSVIEVPSSTVGRSVLLRSCGLCSSCSFIVRFSGAFIRRFKKCDRLYQLMKMLFGCGCGTSNRSHDGGGEQICLPFAVADNFGMLAGMVVEFSEIFAFTIRI